MTSVLIVDDHAVVRAGVKHILSKFADFLVGEADTPDSALRQVADGQWDVALLDISMPEMSGIELLRRIKLKQPATKILIMSMHPEERYALQAIRSGANGYIQKECAGADLANAVRTVAGGKRYVSLTIETSLAESPDSAAALHDVLSPREYEIFYRLGSGQAVTTIADELCLSVKTVSTYRARVLEKMNMKNNAALVYYAIHNNLVD